MTRHLFRVCAITCAAALLGACTSNFGDPARSDLGPEMTSSSMFGDAPSKLFVAKAKENYRQGKFGHAERYYRKAIEVDSKNAEAWLGLAASYDRLRRFDLAKRAYDNLIELTGNTPTVLNNLGYHYMLRGDLDSARRVLEVAYRDAPDNPQIRNNLELLEMWHESPESRPVKHGASPA